MTSALWFNPPLNPPVTLSFAFRCRTNTDRIKSAKSYKEIRIMPIALVDFVLIVSGGVRRGERIVVRLVLKG